MAESFAVSSSLTLKTNVNQVLSDLIEGFERVDGAVKETQEKLAGLGNSIKELGTGKGAFNGLLEELRQLQNLKMGGTLLEDLAKASEFSSSIAGAHQSMRSAAMETAAAWREIAAASKEVRMPAPPGGGTGGNGPGGDERGQRRNQLAGLRYDNDYKLAHQDDALHDLRNDNDRKLADQHNALVDHQKDNVRTLADQANALFEREREHERALADQDNLLFDKKRENGRILADQDNILFDRKQDHMRMLADQENSLFDRKKENIQILAEQENALFDRRRDNMRRTAELDNEHYNTFGTPGQRREASMLDADYNARMAAKKRQEDADKPDSMTHRDLMHAGIGFQMLGDSILGPLGKSVMTSFQYDQEMLPFKYNRDISDDDRKKIDDRARELVREVPGTTAQENLKSISEMFTLTNDLTASLKEAKTYAQMTKVFEMTPGAHQGDHAFASMQSLELLQKFYDPVTHKISADEMAKGMIAEARVALATRGRASPEDYRSMAKQSRAAGMLADDQYLYEDLPAMMIALGGSRAGTAMAGGYREFMRGTMTKASAEDLKRLGFLDKDAEWSHGRVEDMSKHFLGYGEFQRNQIEWAREYGMPQLRRNGINTNDRGQIENAITPMASTNVVLGALSEMLVGLEGIDKEAAKIRNTSVDDKGQPVNPYDKLLKESPMLKFEEFHAAENELLLTLGDLLKGPALQAMRDLTDGIHNLTDFTKNNPNLGKDLALIATGLGVFGTVFGKLALASFFLGPMVKLLTGFAGALSLFAGAGRAAAGLVGLTAGIEGLAAKLGGSTIGAIAKTAVPTAAAVAGGAVAAGAGLGLLGWLGFKGASMTGEDIYKHNQTGETPGMINEFGQPLYYKSAPAQSLVTPPAADAKGTDANPVVVHVQNQTTGADIANGVGTNMARKLNKPQPGVTSSDIRMDLSPAFLGGLAP